ncbi:TLD domain-containing protein KIAA1609 [Myotis davidii]|uniref:MTOR-associated protein MEAK7 n=1 Tax=Myotis davidii TaxID=225400 RepID=L5LZA9_MYODS|nr:TLD domain-containing protein KIAA1609 [Myotis davidii]
MTWPAMGRRGSLERGEQIVEEPEGHDEPQARSHIGEALPPEMVARLYDGMRGVDLTKPAKGPSESVSQEQFTVSMSHLLKGSSREKSFMILKMISATDGPMKAREVQKFTEDLVGSLVHVLSHRQELRGWAQKGAPGPPPRVQALAVQLLSEVKFAGKCPAHGEKLLGPEQLDYDCDPAVIEDWVFRAHLVATFLSVVIHRGFGLHWPLDLSTLVPERQVDQGQKFESVLDLLSVIYVNSHLPREQQHRWHLLFSSELHGHSFAQLCGRVPHQGPSVLLLEDLDGHVFGGFASCSWEIKPQFQVERPVALDWAQSLESGPGPGQGARLLWASVPQSQVAEADVGAEPDVQAGEMLTAFPLQGMGGQHHYFGLWVDVDFGKGHSKAKPTCTTYSSPQLSAHEDFRFEKMEVWAVGDASHSKLANSHKSILDADPEARALLEISGRSRHSEGYRQAPDQE